MGWGSGTTDSGKDIGYMVDATCEHPGCTEEINRGLSYACGGEHGEDEVSCDGYFCNSHRKNWVDRDGTGDCVMVCDSCVDVLLKTGEWIEDEEEGTVIRKEEFE